MVMVDNNQHTPHILHFQVLCNFRKVIGQYVAQKFGKYLVPVSHHASLQASCWRKQLLCYIPLDPILTYYAADFGKELRCKESKAVLFKGRKSQTSGQNQSYTNYYNATTESFPHPSMRMADFYMGPCNKNKQRLKSLFVLGDGDCAVSVKACNNMQDYPCGRRLHKHLQTLPLSWDGSSSLSMRAACYHMDSEQSNNQVTFFPGHLDKPFVHNAWFVPLGHTTFFTVIAVPDTCDALQDRESLATYEEWLEKLAMDEIKRVKDFLRISDLQAKQYHKHQPQKRLIFLNKIGSVLSFAANQYYHATITPKKPTGFPCDLMVFHPLDGTNS